MNRRSAGFTLTEALLVVALVAIFSVVAVPSMTGALAKHNVDDAAERIIQTLEYGRVMAQAYNTPIAMVLDSSANTVTLKRPDNSILKEVTLPEKISISGLSTVTITSTGGFSGTGTIALSSTLDASSSGQVRLETNHGLVSKN